MLATAPTCNVRDWGLKANESDLADARKVDGCNDATWESNKRSIRRQEILILFLIKALVCLAPAIESELPHVHPHIQCADSVSSDGHGAVTCVTGRTVMREPAVDVTPLTPGRLQKATWPELFEASRWCKCREVVSGLPDSNKKREWQELLRGVKIAKRCLYGAKSPLLA